MRILIKEQVIHAPGCKPENLRQDMEAPPEFLAWFKISQQERFTF